MNLYTDYAQEFSNTRQEPWHGWERLISSEYFSTLRNSKLRILDLGCGNGRFLKFLLHKGFSVERYVGIDNSAELLKIANEECEGLDFKLANRDLNKGSWSKEIDEKFDLIVAFGLMHHMESFEARRAILENSCNLLDAQGLLVATYWQFYKFERYKDKLREKGQGSHDFDMSFGKNGASRFVHYTDEEEIEKLEEGLDLNIIDSFYADGKEGDQNWYRVYRR